MFSLILAAIYVACRVLFSNDEPLSAFESTLGFLWGWHMTFAVFKASIWVAVPVIGAALGATGDDQNQRMAGIATVLVSPLLLILMLISSVLFLGGVYALDSGVQNGEIVNQNHFVMGGILYFLAILMQLRSSVSSKSKD